MKIFRNIYMLCLGILVMLTLPVFASDGKEIPQENVKLTGQYYAYPIGLDGSPYLQEDWQIGNLFLENGKVAYNVKIQFNIITNDLIFYNESLKRVFMADKGTIRSFVMNPGSKDSLIFMKYVGNVEGYKLKKDDFVHVLCQGKVTFMVKHTADIIGATEANSKDKVFPKDIYFANYKNQTSEIKLSYRSVYSLFPSKKKEIKKIVSENRIRKATKNNLVKLFMLIDKVPEF